jgi:putative spermidine/putrescine transport system permease protein
MVRSLSDKLFHLALGLLAACALVILVGPVLIALATSFTPSASLKFPPPGFSLRWYTALFDPVLSGHIHRAALNSAVVALAATLLSVSIAVPAVLALRAMGPRRGAVLDTLFMSPMVLPLLAYGLAALIFFSWLSIRPSLATLIIGHTIVVVPLVLRTTAASLVQLDKALWESSESLGAGPWFTFRRTTLPLIRPGILAGAFLAFVLSFDNVPVSIFLSSVNTDMLPVRMWGMMEASLDVRVAAISGIMIVVTIVTTLAMERLVGITRRLET